MADSTNVSEAVDDSADIVDAELVEGGILDTASDLNSDQDKANLVVQLEGLIKTHISKIDKLREDLSEQKVMLADSFENDTTYREHAEAAKEANKIKSKTKSEILKRPEVAIVAEKVKSMASELKEYDAALSDYLSEFNKVSGISEIEGEDGELMQIVYVAKLKRKITP